MSLELQLALGAFVVSAALVGVSIVVARRAGHFDVPNSRSSHEHPTPSGAGIGFVATVLLLGTAETLRVQPHFAIELGVVGLAVAALAVVGGLDDRFSLSPPVRFAVHIAVSLTVVVLVNRIAPLPGYWNAAWLLLWGFWTVSSINIVNFMDGIDGMVGAQALVYGLYLYAILPHDSLARALGLILAFASLGFLIWNWAPAKIFMGDVGSGPLGMMLVIAGALAVNAGMNPALVFLPLFPLFFDALATVLLRLKRGERLTIAHRSHLYQRVARRSVDHPVVSVSYAAGAAAGALIGDALKGADASMTSAGILCYTGLIVSLWMFFHRRFPPVHTS
jgi:Fuc2NAc and GlcNAc transferase